MMKNRGFTQHHFMYYVYILQSKLNNNSYVGSTNDLKNRFKDHNEGKVISTKRYKPWELVYYEAYMVERLARMREKRLKHNGNAIRELKKRIELLKSGAGFTLVELLLVMSIMAILLGFITISLVKSQQTASLTTTEEILIAELKEQQLKSMIGDTEGRPSSDSYGIHFDSNRYVTFHGGVYSEADTSNSFFNLESNMQFNNPNFNVVFSRLNGEITSPFTIELQDNTNSRLKRIYLNKYGVITQVESL